MIKLSIIIPIYNPPATFSKLLLDLKNNQNSEMEIIFVDDLSTNGVLDELEHFEFNHPQQVHIIKLTKKGYASGARNTGLLQATGKYVNFIDADDAIVEDYFQIVRPYLENQEDLILFNRYTLQNKELSKQHYVMMENVTLNHQEFLKSHLDNTYGGVWTAFFKRETLVNNQVFFRQEYRISNDVAFWLSVSEYINSARYINKYIYTFISNSSSLSNTVGIEHFESLDAIYHEYQAFFQKHQLHDNTPKRVSLLFTRFICVLENYPLNSTNKQLLKSFIEKHHLENLFKENKKNFKNLKLKILSALFINNHFALIKKLKGIKNK